MADIARIQQEIRAAGCDGWLLYDFHNRDLVAYRVLGLDPNKFTSRRWFYWIPAHGEPVRLLSKVEPLKLDALEGDTANSEVRADRARRIGSLALRANHIESAVTHLDTAVKAGIADAATLALLARARWAQGDRPGARDALERALALDKTNADLRRLERTMR